MLSLQYLYKSRDNSEPAFLPVNLWETVEKQLVVIIIIFLRNDLHPFNSTDNASLGARLNRPFPAISELLQL